MLFWMPLNSASIDERSVSRLDRSVSRFVAVGPVAVVGAFDGPVPGPVESVEAVGVVVDGGAPVPVALAAECVLEPHAPNASVPTDASSAVARHFPLVMVASIDRQGQHLMIGS